MYGSMRKSPEQAFALQKYLLLHSQHDALQKTISNSTVSTSSASPACSPSSSIASSPTSTYEPLDSTADYISSSSTSKNNIISSSTTDSTATTTAKPRATSKHSPRPTLLKRRSSLPAALFSTTSNPTAAFEEADSNMANQSSNDEQKLHSVNLQIKTTLTALLNCESVRGDRQARMWVQDRLMNAERELRVDRRCSLSQRRRSVDVDLDERGRAARL